MHNEYETIYEDKEFTYLRPEVSHEFLTAVGMAWLIVVFGAALYFTL